MGKRIVSNADGFTTCEWYFATVISIYASYILVRRHDKVKGCSAYGLWLIRTRPLPNCPLQYELYIK